MRVVVLSLLFAPAVRGNAALATTLKGTGYEAVAQPIYTRAIGRWEHYEELLAPAMKALEPFIREFGYA